MKNTYDQIFLADDEWGNDTMKAVADEWFRDHPDCQFVQVHEHGGWWLGWHRSGQIIGTANGSAVLDPNRPRPESFSGVCHRRETPLVRQLVREALLQEVAA